MKKPNDRDSSLRLELFSANVEQSVNFYTQILNFSNEDNSINHTYQQVKKGSIVLGIASEAEMSENHFLRLKGNDSQRGMGVEIVLEVDNVLAAYQQAKRSGYPIHAQLQDRTWGLTDFRLVDPDGYYIRVTSRKD